MHLFLFLGSDTQLKNILVVNISDSDMIRKSCVIEYFLIFLILEQENGYS